LCACYTPLLPKTPPTSLIIVLNVSHDLSSKSWQGLVNRNSREKIYFVNMPQEHDFTPWPADQAALDDGIIPVLETRPTLDTTKTYPVLSFLLQNFSSVIKGKIYYPSLSSSVVNGAVMAAITACGIEDAVPVSEAIDAYITKEGRNFKTVADTRPFGNNIEAHNWSVTRYFNQTTRAFLGQFSFTVFGGNVQDQHPIFFDYLIASRAFIMSLDAHFDNEKQAMATLLNTKNYPAGIPVLGMPVDEGVGLSYIQSLGYYVTIIQAPNFSVTSSFPSDPSLIRPPPPPKPATVDNNGLYVSFFVSDGDSVGFSVNFHYNWWKNSPDKGQLPIGWSFNPLLLDLFPTFLQWSAVNNYNNKYQLISDRNDGVAPSTQEGATAFAKSYATLLQNTQGVFDTINYFGDAEKEKDLITTIKPYFDIEGYQGNTNGNQVRWGEYNDIIHGSQSGSTQSTATPQEIYNSAAYVATHTPNGTPAFVVVPIGDSRWSGDPVARAKAAVQLLQANPPAGRKLYLLIPRDLAATWKASGHHSK